MLILDAGGKGGGGEARKRERFIGSKGNNGSVTGRRALLIPLRGNGGEADGVPEATNGGILLRLSGQEGFVCIYGKKRIVIFEGNIDEHDGIGAGHE